MFNVPFEVTVPGKWVLAGEHAVLRGAMAIALPLEQFKLTLRFTPNKSGEGLVVSPLVVFPAETGPIIVDVIREFRDICNVGAVGQLDLSGFLEIQSTIPIGAGLGSSAAFCVAITKWLASFTSIPKEKWQEIATTLECRFHGKSSGMDVAVIISGKPIVFTRNQSVGLESDSRVLNLRRIPKFTFHDTGVRALTSECIAKVEKLKAKDPEKAKQLDAMMDAAARKAYDGLLLYDSEAGTVPGTVPGSMPGIIEDQKAGIVLLVQAMKEAQKCFEAWGLVPLEAKKIEEQLYREGALAVKLTGAGGGGMLVAL